MNKKRFLSVFSKIVLCLWLTSSVVARELQHSDKALRSCWQRQVCAPMEMDMPLEKWTTCDIDGDGHAEVLMNGGGMNAVFLVSPRGFTLVAKSFGEYESIKSSADGYVVYTQQSGRSAQEWVKQYFRLKKSRLAWTLECRAEPDENEENLKVTHKVNGKPIARKSLQRYLPKKALKPLFENKNWNFMAEVE